MDDTLQFKQQVEDVEIIYEVLPGIDYSNYTEEEKIALIKDEVELDMLLRDNKDKIDKVNKQIDNVTVRADKFDYTIAACSGILAGMLDVFMVGEMDAAAIDAADPMEWAKTQTENTVIKMAGGLGFQGKDLNGAIKYMTENAGEGPGGINVANVLQSFTGQLQPVVSGFMEKNQTLSDLITSMLTQFTGSQIGTDEAGNIVASEMINKDLIGNDFGSRVFNGITHWFINTAVRAARSGQLGENLGIPAPLMELAGKIAKLPAFTDSSITDNDVVKLVADISKNAEEMKQADTQVILKQTPKMSISRQATPVLINECIVRSFYFITRFAQEIEDKNIQSFAELKNIDMRTLLPVNNATVSRMMAVSLGTMEAIDIAGAAIKGAVAATEAGGAGAAVGAAGGPVGVAGGAVSASTAAFWKTFVLNINFTGVGRMAISCVTEANIGAEREKLLSNRIKLLNDRLMLMDSKVYYNEAEMWVAAEEAGRAIDEAYAMMGHTSRVFNEMVQSVTTNINKVSEYTPAIDEKNPGLKEKMQDILKWGI